MAVELDLSTSLQPIYQLANFIVANANRRREDEKDLILQAQRRREHVDDVKSAREFSVEQQKAQNKFLEGQAADARIHAEDIAREARGDRQVELEMQREFSIKQDSDLRKFQKDLAKEARDYADKIREEERSEKRVEAANAHNKEVDTTRRALWTVSGFIDATDTMPEDGTLEDDKAARKMASKKLVGLLKAQQAESEKVDKLFAKHAPNLMPHLRRDLVGDPAMFAVFGDNKALAESFQNGTISVTELMGRLGKKERDVFATAYAAKLEGMKGSLESAELRQAVSAMKENTSRYNDLNQGIQQYLGALQRVSPGSIPEAFAEVYGAPQGGGKKLDPLDDFMGKSGYKVPGAGLQIPGNIDLNNRPQVKNADGTTSTVRTISVGIDGKEYLIPTVTDDGRVVSDEEAIELFKKTGRHFGAFDTPENATAYAQALHQQQAATLAPTVAPPVAAAGTPAGRTLLFPEGASGVLPAIDRMATTGAEAIASGVESITSLAPGVLREMGGLFYTPPPGPPVVSPPLPLPSQAPAQQPMVFPPIDTISTQGGAPLPILGPPGAPPQIDPGVDESRYPSEAMTKYFPGTRDMTAYLTDALAASMARSQGGAAGLTPNALPIPGANPLPPAVPPYTGPQMQSQPAQPQVNPQDPRQAQAMMSVFGTADMGALQTAKQWFIQNSGMPPADAQREIDRTIEAAFKGDVAARIRIRKVMQSALGRPAPMPAPMPNTFRDDPLNRFLQPPAMPGAMPPTIPRTFRDDPLNRLR